MKKGVRILLYVVFIIIILTSLVVIDYSTSKLYGRVPILVIKKEDKEKQYIKYSGIFYTMWVCTAEENNYSINQEPMCPKRIDFNNGIYTSDKNIEITIRDYKILQDYFSFTDINEFETRDDLIRALEIAGELHETTFTTKEGYTTTHEGEEYMIAMFQRLTLDSSGTFSYGINENDLSGHYCIKQNDTKTRYLISRYDGTKCTEEFKELELSQEWCNKAGKYRYHDSIRTQYETFCK